MGRDLILDTAVLIAYVRGSIDRRIFDDDDVAVAAITIAELRTGIELADSAVRSAQRSRTIDAIISEVGVLDYTSATASHHARLLAYVGRRGQTRGAHDLIIAAHAAETSRVLVSLDAAARFGELPGVEAIAPG